MKRFLLKALVLSATFVPALFGTMVTYTTSFPETTADFSGSLPIKQFDPGLGTLSFLTITLTGDVEGSASITNSNTNTKTYRVTLASDVTLIDALLNVMVAILPTYTTTVAGPGNSTMSVSGYGGDTQTNSYNDAPTLSEFTGTGNLSATLDGEGSNGFMGGSNSTFVANATTGGSVTIVYTYVPGRVTSTPEPLTSCLIGSGLVALGLLKPRTKNAPGKSYFPV